jgi:hypothetical protein
MITPSKALFVLPSIQWDGDSVSVRGTIVDKATLRYAALYWDWVRVPVPLGPAQDAIDDYIELENSGFLHPHFPSEERIRAAFQDYATQRWGLTIGTLTMNRVHLNHLRMIFPDRRAAVEPERDAPLMLAALRESLAVIEEDGTYDNQSFKRTRRVRLLLLTSRWCLIAIEHAAAFGAPLNSGVMLWRNPRQGRGVKAS